MPKWHVRESGITGQFGSQTTNEPKKYTCYIQLWHDSCEMRHIATKWNNVDVSKTVNTFNVQPWISYLLFVYYVCAHKTRQTGRQVVVVSYTLAVAICFRRAKSVAAFARSFFLQHIAGHAYCVCSLFSTFLVKSSNYLWWIYKYGGWYLTRHIITSRLNTVQWQRARKRIKKNYGKQIQKNMGINKYI